MKSSQAGFTLIELVVVIVLLGIVGAVATARFQNLSVAAADAVEKGVAAELASSSAVNYGASVSGGGTPTAITGTVACATTAPLLLQAGALPSSVTASDDVDVTCTGAGDTVRCMITHSSGSATNAFATLICTG